MGFMGVYRAVYDYAPQAKGELAIGEGDILYVLDINSDEGWWKAKKKAGADDDEEPEGLVPNNYVEPAPALSHARAIYEYTRQTDEELSFSEDAILEIFDTTDPDWILAGADGEYGFVPSNYIEFQGTILDVAPRSPDASPELPARPPSLAVAAPDNSQASSHPSSFASPEATLAGVMQSRAATQLATPSPPPIQPARLSAGQDGRHASEEDESEPIWSPALPSRPRPGPNIVGRPRSFPAPARDSVAEPPSGGDEPYRTPGGFRMYNINEMVTIMGKKKKMPTTLGINLKTGMILIAPERAQDDPAQEWTADKMTHYSREGKHVFMELIRPSKSMDFHAGAKDTAEEIVGALGELAGAVRAEGLREVIMAGSQRNRRKGQVLYDFMAQGDDEVTVAAGDVVVILDNSKSDEWWQVRRLKNGKEGVIPSSYIEVTGIVTSPVPAGDPDLELGKATVEQNRLDEIRLTKEATKTSKESQQVGRGTTPPARGSSLKVQEHGSNSGQQRGSRENGRSDSASYSKAKSKPDSAKVRTWTDRSGSFSVEAQFLGLKDGKIHLHKMNGVKIAVPIGKMSRADLEYVESATGISLDDEKPLADIKRAKPTEKRPAEVGATVGEIEKPEYDWFQFFLSCDVAVGLCERYAQAFLRDSMDESVLPDVNATILRTLGLREGDIIKVMRTLDAKYGRDRTKGGADGDGGTGGLFSGPGGTLRNNTRKGRPAPTVQTNDVVDAATFSNTNASRAGSSGSKSLSAATNNKADSAVAGGFDDDAWNVQPRPQEKPTNSTKSRDEAVKPVLNLPSITPALIGSMKELSLLSEPLEPTKTEAQSTGLGTSHLSDQPPRQAQQPTGASPSFFSAMPEAGQLSPESLTRQRPLPLSILPNQGSLVPPPPQRLPSAPQVVFATPTILPQIAGAIQSQAALPGQSLSDLSQARLQQQYGAQMQQQQELQPTMTGYAGMQPQGLASFTTGGPGQFMQPMITGMPGVSPFADPSRPSQFSPFQTQPAGFQPTYTPGMPIFSQAPDTVGNVNSFLPPALEPQRTGILPIQPQQTGLLGTGGVSQSLQPQKTGPPPTIRFGFTETKKLAPQQTGRRANLAHATPQNPFGF